MCFWLAALWLNTVFNLGGQDWLASLTPTGLHHMQVWFCIQSPLQVVGCPVGWACMRFSVNVKPWLKPQPYKDRNEPKFSRNWQTLAKNVTIRNHTQKKQQQKLFYWIGQLTKPVNCFKSQQYKVYWSLIEEIQAHWFWHTHTFDCDMIWVPNQRVLESVVDAGRRGAALCQGWLFVYCGSARGHATHQICGGLKCSHAITVAISFTALPSACFHSGSSHCCFILTSLTTP